MRKKLTALVLAAAMVLTALTACAQAGTGAQSVTGETTTSAAADAAAEAIPEEEGAVSAETAAKLVDPSQIKTIGDVYAIAESAGDGEYQEAYNETVYCYVFKAGGVYYRAYAEIPEDVAAVLWGTGLGDEDPEAKLKELISPLEVAYFENLSERIPPQEELDKYIGRTGQELFDEGWTYWYYNLADMEAGMEHGAFSYVVRFDYEGEQMVNSDDFDFYEEFKDLTVKSVTFEALGDAASPEDIPKSMQTGTAGSNIPLKDNLSEAEYQIRVAMQYKMEEMYGDKVNDARIYIDKIYSAEDEEAFEPVRDMHLGPNEIAFELHLELHPSNEEAVNELLIPNGEYDEESGWVKNVQRLGVLRENPDGGLQKYIITDFGTGW